CRTVDVGLSFARAFEKTFVVETDHDRHHRRVGELARPREVFDDVANGRRAPLPKAGHHLGLERTEELFLGLLGSAQATKVRPSHPPIISRAVRAVTLRRRRRRRGWRSERPSRPWASATWSSTIKCPSRGSYTGPPELSRRSTTPESASAASSRSAWPCSTRREERRVG